MELNNQHSRWEKENHRSTVTAAPAKRPASSQNDPPAQSKKAKTGGSGLNDSAMKLLVENKTVAQVNISSLLLKFSAARFFFPLLL